MNWYIKEIPVPLSNTTRYNLIDGDTGEVIGELSNFTKEQRDLIEAAPLLLEALKALTSNEHIDLGDLIYKVRENEGLGWEGPSVTQWSDAVQKAQAAIAKTEGKSHG